MTAACWHAIITHGKIRALFFGGKSMKILLCDDETAYLISLENYVQEYMKNHFLDCDITAVRDPAVILSNQMSFDLAFLDIQMEGTDGIQLAQELRRRNEKTVLFFITNYEAYQDAAMDLQALRFFKKPFDPARLYAGLDRAMEYIDGSYVEVFLQEKGQLQKILVDTIRYITRENRKTMLIAQNGSKHCVGKTVDEWSRNLPQRFFYQVHKSFLVNLHYVSIYSNTELLLDDGTRIPIAPKKRPDFRKFWFLYLGGRQG